MIKSKGAANEGNPDVSSNNVDDIPPELENDIAYFVHYKGWKSTWDEWIRDDRVLLWNEENIRTQKELKQAALAQASAASGKKKGLAGSSLGDVADSKNSPSKDEYTRNQKRGGRGASGAPSGFNGPPTSSAFYEDLESQDEYSKRSEIALAVPEVLKGQLVDDWEYITKNHQLVTLPREPNVVEILKKYRDATASTRQPGSAEEDIFDEVISGIKLYFDKSLGNILLYRFERQQYLDVRREHPDVPMSELYGAEHLLRLFISLPGLVAQTNMDHQSVNVLREHLEVFLKYMARNKDELFQKDYENTTAKYEAYAKGG